MDWLRSVNFLDANIPNNPLGWTFAIVALAFLIIKWDKHRKWVGHFEDLPGPPTRFLVGNLDRSISIYNQKKALPNSVYILQQICANAVLYGKEGIYRFWFSFTPVVTAFKPDVVEAILSSSTSLDKSWEYDFLHPWLGLGLLTSTGPKWRSRRKILTPSFHFRILEDFIPVFNEQSMVLVKKLQALAEEDWVGISPLVTLCTLDVVSESVMGVRIEAQNDSESDYVKAIHELGDYFNIRVARPWLWQDFIFNFTQEGKTFRRNIDILHRFTRKVIKERKESMLANQDLNKVEKDEDKDNYTGGKKRRAFLDLLLDMHIKEQSLSEEDIREEVDTFMFEGHDTTAMGISWTLYCLGMYPQVQKKVAEELDAIFGDDKLRAATHDDLRRMKYMECMLKESHRLYPPVPLIGRCLSEDVAIRGKKILKGTDVHIHLNILHRDEKEFPNPELFDPDRFLPENAAKRHPFAFVPFSAGPRNCIGQKFAMMEEKVIISNILRHFELVSMDPRDKVHGMVEFVLRSAETLRIKFLPRNPRNTS